MSRFFRWLHNVAGGNINAILIACFYLYILDITNYSYIRNILILIV